MGGGLIMATSSIKKEFTVKDVAKYEALLREINKMPDITLKTPENSSLKKGHEPLKNFNWL
jgi:hypothetical protein